MSEHAVARRGDPWTSWEAADAVHRIRESQKAILDVLGAWGPMTDEELVEHYETNNVWPHQEPSGIRTRRKELVNRGLVFDTGDFERGRTNRRMILWGTSPKVAIATAVTAGQTDLGL